MVVRATDTAAIWSKATVVRASLFAFLAVALVLVATGNARAAGFDLVMAAVTVAVGRIFCSTTDPGFARRLLLGALALHWLLVCTLQLVLAARGHLPLVTSDEHGYDRIAVELSRSWLGTGPTVPHVDVYLEGPFASLLGAVYTVGGYTPFAGLTIPIAFGTWIPVLVHRLMADRFGSSLAQGRRAARIAALAALLFPTALGWSCLLLKDSSVTFAGLAVVVGLLALGGATQSRHERAIDVALGLFGIVWLSTNRAVVLVPTAVAVAVVAARWTLRQPRRRRFVLIAAIACALVAGGAVPQVRRQLDRIPTKLAVHRSLSRLGARTAEAAEGRPSEATWLSTVAHVPAGLALVLLRPYPTEVQDASQTVGVAGNLLNLIFCAVATLGIAGAWRAGRQSETLLLAVTIAITWLVLSVAEGNAGTAWRHRDEVTPLIACFAGLALAGSPRAARIADTVRLRLSRRPTRSMQMT